MRGIIFAVLLVLIIGAGFYFWKNMHTSSTPAVESASNTMSEQHPSSGEEATALLAGGCFWCVEADMEKAPGVLGVVSGYAGGTTENPVYENYSTGGHREVVEVTYDPQRISYGQLVEYLIKHIDPTDGEGSFYDRGFQYAPAIYYANDEEKRVAEEVIARIDGTGVYAKPLAVAVLPRPAFWSAEEYHQDYYKKSTLKYSFYRRASGRDAFVEKHWGENAGVLTEKGPERASARPWESFVKPSDEELRERLSPMQYKVTQEEGTEPAFQNEYDKNKEEGIYVDIVSGEPLFSSLDKYDSGTGWPSFTKPLAPENIVEKTDYWLILPRTEIRSKYGDSHLGHVFTDGPEPTGLRYCMNSAALRFVPKADLEKEGYGEYLSLFE